MKQRTAVQTHGDTMALAIMGLHQHATVRVVPEHEMAFHDRGEKRFGHDFSRVPVRTVAPMMVQPKLTIGQPGDKYEQEADQVVERVMRMPEPAIQLAPT